MNPLNGLTAITKDMRLFIISLFHYQLFIGFMVGILLTVLIIGFILTKNPYHIPILLRYSPLDSFKKITPRSEDGTYQSSYISFLKLYGRIKILFLLGFIAFCVMVSTILLTTTS